MIELTSIPLVLWAVGCAAFVIVGHELTHYIAWLPVATSIEYHFEDQYIEAEYPDTRFARRWAAVAGISPVIVAIGLVLALMASGWDPTATWHHITASAAVVLYGISGGKSDFTALLTLVRTRRSPAVRD
jgi:hypothetical protein